MAAQFWDPFSKDFKRGKSVYVSEKLDGQHLFENLLTGKLEWGYKCKEEFTVPDRKVIYPAKAFNEMTKRLMERGFKHTNLWEWTFEFSNNQRYIKVTIEDNSYCTVDFNAEKVIRQSPYGVLAGLDAFGGG